MAKVERYVRLSVAGLLHEDDEYIVGLEFDHGELLSTPSTTPRGETLAQLRFELHHAVFEAVGYALTAHEAGIPSGLADIYKRPYRVEYDALIAEGLHQAIDERWPGRAHFIEVQHDNPDGWVQVFQPYGLPQDPA